VIQAAWTAGGADVYDAMTSHRSYRGGLPKDFVPGELQSMAGRRLDADALALALAACRELAIVSNAAFA
jgi:HD-GYP domain-containing protein (c-di-GMP phosphodiesterase class II)